MDTLFEDKNQFKIILTYSERKEHHATKEYSELYFFTNLNDLGENSRKYIEFEENSPLKLTFYSEDQSATCYMDGFDILNDEALIYDEVLEQKYIFANTTVKLFEYTNYGKGYYPYIPGIYTIKVIIKGVVYYSYIKVKAKHLTEDSLSIMREDVQTYLKGLATDIVRKQPNKNKDSNIKVDSEMLDKYFVLKQYFNEIRSILTNLIRNPRHSIKKDYEMKSINQPLNIDSISIRHRLKHPEATQYIKSLKKVISYNNPENIILKRIIENWVDFLNKFLESIKYSLKENQKYNKKFSEYTPNSIKEELFRELENYSADATKMINSLNKLRENNWYKEIEIKNNTFLNFSKVYLDFRYKKFIEINKLMFSNEKNIDFDSKWNYHWKRTDQLYEIWGFIQLIEVLSETEYNFEIDPSDYFNNSYWGNSKNLLIPVIPEGTKFKLIKGDLVVNVLYNSLIPKKQEKTDLHDKPIYTTGKNTKPDMRLDVYIKEIYVGTILLDTKYRAGHFVQNEVKNNQSVQLTSYADNVRSKFIYGRKKTDRIRPVHKVVVLYPEQNQNNINLEEIAGRSISFLPLTPNADLTKFKFSIESLISEVIAEAEENGIMPSQFTS
ncbi:DUF2357 domain-containing protein [Bacillus safensis]|uniref:DUF2357 domain-containing protein n=1 Tax=Bacillus safensis TaxID=561879 RepID=UPI00398359F4